MKGSSRKQFLVGFLVVMFASIAIGGVVASLHLDENGAMINCPFMAGEQAMCPMGLVQHLGDWQLFFTAVVPMIIFVAALIVVNRKLISVSVTVSSFYTQHRNKKMPQRFLQRLFSKGILHSKLYAG